MRRPILLVVLLASAGCTDRAAPFAKSMKDWDVINLDGAIPQVAEGEMPYRTGKLFVMRVDPRSPVIMQLGGRKEPFVEPAWYDLEDDLRAASPEEAATLVQTLPATVGGTRRVTSIEGGGELQTRTETVKTQLPLRVIDLKRGVLVGTWLVPFDEKGEYARNLGVFLRNMPVRTDGS